MKKSSGEPCARICARTWDRRKSRVVAFGNQVERIASRPTAMQLKSSVGFGSLLAQGARNSGGGIANHNAKTCAERRIDLATMVPVTPSPLFCHFLYRECRRMS